MNEEKAIVPVDQDPYVAMERADEGQVLAEMQGRFIQELVYSFSQGGQDVTGLSLAGVRETVRTMNSRGLSRIRISEREPKITETDDYYQVMVYAEDTANGGGAWGVKRQEKRHAKGSVNVFAMEMALSKAQRNAQRALIPEYFVKAMIEEFMAKRGSVKRVNPAQRPTQQPAKSSGAKPATTTTGPSMPPLEEEAPGEAPGQPSGTVGGEQPKKITHREFWPAAFAILGTHTPQAVYDALKIQDGIALEVMGWGVALAKLQAQTKEE